MKTIISLFIIYFGSISGAFAGVTAGGGSGTSLVGQDLQALHPTPGEGLKLPIGPKLKVSKLEFNHLLRAAVKSQTINIDGQAMMAETMNFQTRLIYARSLENPSEFLILEEASH